MINFYRITSPDDPFFADFFNLYKTSFPPEERRSLEDFELELSNSPHFYAHALFHNKEFVGIFNYWIFDGFYYLEHFAIEPELRGQQLGSKALKVFKSQIDAPIVFEVEMPNNLPAVQRVKFYENLGFSSIGHSYSQPSYDKSSDEMIPMLLMSDSVRFTNTNFNQIKEIIYDQVYHFTEKKRF